MNTPDIYTYPEGASPLELARYQVAVMEAAARGEPVEFMSCFGHWEPVKRPVWGWHNTLYRIVRPKPAKIAEGHNPDGLTEEQVGAAEGWRLLAREELRGQAGDEIKDVAVVLGDEDDDWQFLDHRCSLSADAFTYRTKKPVGFFLPKPPVQAPLVPWTFATAPKGCVLVRFRENPGHAQLITSWGSNAVSYGNGDSANRATYAELLDLREHSLDGGLTWQPCGSTS